LSGLSNVSALLGGGIFGAGLVVSGMTDPQKVLAFLTLNSGWDPALIFVMGSAVIVATIGYWLVNKRAAPLFDSEFYAPASNMLDRPLLGGAALFGVGWGVAGFCPGPALVGLMTLDRRALLFIVAYAVGVVIFDKLVSPMLNATKMSMVDG
jgi:uncharacterized membrane protein YedE/YeeE